MAEEKKVETSVDELVEDLKNKIDSITQSASNIEGDNRQKANEIVEKAVAVLSNASNKVVETAKKFPDSPEVARGIEIVKAKSKDLYENALSRIEEIKKSNIVEETVETVKETVETVKETVENIANNETVQNVVETVKQEAEVIKQEVNEFVQKPEVKEAVNNAKEATVEVAEKGLALLKEWLAPDQESDNSDKQ